MRGLKEELVTGAGGFIGRRLIKRLKCDGRWLRGADIKLPEYGATESSISIAEWLNTNNREIGRELTEAGRPKPAYPGRCKCS